MRWSRLAQICRIQEIGRDCTEVSNVQPDICRSQMTGTDSTPEFALKIRKFTRAAKQ